MKFSVITACFNSEATIRDTINSVLDQSYNDFEHIIIDGCSDDDTLMIIREMQHEKLIVVSEQDHGLYDAMNKGVYIATGDVICFLNSDDFYENSRVLESVKSRFTDCTDIVYGNVLCVKKDDSSLVTRRIALKSFKAFFMKFGWMPPHPGTFVRRRVFDDCGNFNLAFEVAADYEFFIRAIYVRSSLLAHLDVDVVKMREGGVSNRGIHSYLQNTSEIERALKLNGISGNHLLLFIRLPVKFVLEKLGYKFKRCLESIWFFNE